MTEPDTLLNDDQHRVLVAGLIIAEAVADPEGDRPAARQRAFDLLTDDDVFVFAIYLAVCAGWIFAEVTPCGDCGSPGCTNHVITIDVTDSDGTTVSIDDVDKPTRTAWRAVLAAANGDSPADLLRSVTSEDEAAQVATALVQLYEAAVAVSIQEHTS